MKIIKKIFSILREIFSNLWLTILTLFRVEPVNEERKVINISKPQKEEKKDTIYKDTDIPIPDENPSKSNNEYQYKQSVGTVSNDIKEEIKAKVNKREIYFSDMVVLNLIVESLEEKAKFSYKDLSNDKKELVNTEVEKIQERISPSLKKSMSLNKITTKEELKSEIDRKIIPYVDKVNKITTKDVVTDLPSEKELFHREEIPEDKTVEIPILKEEAPKKEVIKIVKREETIDKPKEEKKELFKVEKVHKKDPNSNVYFMADLLKNKQRELDIEDSIKVSEDTQVIPNLQKEIAQSIQAKSKKLPFIMVPNNEESTVKIKDKIRNAAVVAPLAVAATIDTPKEEEKVKDIVIDTPKEEVTDEQPKEVTITYDEDIPEIPKLKEEVEDIHKEMLDELEAKPVIKVTSSNKDKKFSADNIKTLVQEMEEVNQDIESKKIDIDLIKEEKDIKKDIDNKEEDIEDKLIKTANLVVEEINNKAEEEIVKSKVDNRIINNYNEQYLSVEDKLTKEKEKFDFEDRNYEYLDSKVDDILYSLEMFEIENEDKMNSSDKEKIDNTRKKLRDLKVTISNQKDIDLDEEKKELDSKITKKEIDNLNKEVEKLHIDHQEELDSMLLFKIKQIEQYSDKEIEEKETILIKSKLRKALLAAEIPSILSLPFIRNRYFFYFTVGLIVNNHFNFLNAVFKRKDIPFEPIDLSDIKTGKDSLDKAIGLTYKNMVYLDYLEKEALNRYPKLAQDEEFNKYIKNIRAKLNKNYTKLNNKQKILDKYILKINKKNKVLKKYKLIREES